MSWYPASVPVMTDDDPSRNMSRAPIDPRFKRVRVLEGEYAGWAGTCVDQIDIDTFAVWLKPACDPERAKAVTLRLDQFSVIALTPRARPDDEPSQAELDLMVSISDDVAAYQNSLKVKDSGVLPAPEETIIQVLQEINKNLARIADCLDSSYIQVRNIDRFDCYERKD